MISYDEFECYGLFSNNLNSDNSLLELKID